jgi:hypothetical protein
MQFVSAADAMSFDDKGNPKALPGAKAQIQPGDQHEFSDQIP